MNDKICPLCNKPIVDGDAIYTIPDKNGLIRHFECWDKVAGKGAKEELAKTIQRMKETLEKIKRLS